MTALQQAFARGFKDRIQGRRNNPYLNPLLVLAYERGWEKAKEKEKK